MNMIKNFYVWLLDILFYVNMYFFEIITGIDYGTAEQQTVVLLMFILYFLEMIFLLMVFNLVWKVFSRIYFAVVSNF